MRKSLLRGHSGQTSNSPPDVDASISGRFAFDFAMASDLRVKRGTRALFFGMQRIKPLSFH